jgi:pimeloyl-ACP methyl ester carboxylesterase
MDQPRFHAMPDGRQIAFRHLLGSGPTIVFLPGYRSDMAGGKATALAEWAAAQGRGCLLFAEGTLGRWQDEAAALLANHVAGPVVLVGSSMGGWLALLLGRALGPRVVGLVGIAAAPDFTDWGFTSGQKRRLAAGETLFEDNPYGPEPTPTHAGFWTDGQARRVLGGQIPIDCPVRLLHGQDDGDVPPEISLRLARALRSLDVQVTLAKGGDHRLSRDGDIALLLRTVTALA